MTDLADRDYYSDPEILRDPYAFFDELRRKTPVLHHAMRDVVFVTGYDEVLEVMRNTADFSAANATAGGSMPLPFTPQGDDIADEIEAHRSDFIAGHMLTSLDGRPHAFRRALVTRLFTPSRLLANEPYARRIAEELVAAAVAKGGCDVIADVAKPLATLTVANLLGVPDDDREVFRKAIGDAPPPGSTNGVHDDNPFVVMRTHFAHYVADRRVHPRDDVISELANARFPDGTQPVAEEIVNLGVFIFGAGQDTTVKLIGNAMRYVVETPGPQARLRGDRALVPAMIEEVLRLQGATKSVARVAKRDTTVGGMPIRRGTQVVASFAAANRDPKRWDDPDGFRMGARADRGTCRVQPRRARLRGRPLARLETRVAFETFLERAAEIDIDETRHGPPGARARIRAELHPARLLRTVRHAELTFGSGRDGAAGPSCRPAPNRASSPRRAPMRARPSR